MEIIKWIIIIIAALATIGLIGALCTIGDIAPSSKDYD